MKDGKTIAERIKGYCDAAAADKHRYPTTIARNAENYSIHDIGETDMLRAWADEIEEEIEAARQTPKWHEEFQAFATEELERPMLDGESIKAWLERNYTERPRPDTQERIDEDAQKVVSDYWGCNDVYCCECDVCDGASPKHRYGADSCHTAKTLDLLRRQRELDGRHPC